MQWFLGSRCRLLFAAQIQAPYAGVKYYLQLNLLVFIILGVLRRSLFFDILSTFRRKHQLGSKHLKISKHFNDA